VANAGIERHSAVIERDLPELYSFIAKHDPIAAGRVLDAIEETFDQLARHPDSGASYPTPQSKTTGAEDAPGNSISRLSYFPPPRGD
jgi:plasmid stabilization system protein ParE